MKLKLFGAGVVCIGLWMGYVAYYNSGGHDKTVCQVNQIGNYYEVMTASGTRFIIADDLRDPLNGVRPAVDRRSVITQIPAVYRFWVNSLPPQFTLNHNIERVEPVDAAPQACKK